MLQCKAVVAMLAVGVLSVGAGCGGPEEVQAPSKSCWVDLGTSKSLCVDKPGSLANAVLETHGVLIKTDDDSMSPSASALSTFQRGGMHPLVTVVVGIIYEHVNYEGASVVFTNSSGCSGSWYYQYELGSFGFNDRLSSFNSYSNCRTTLYEHNGYAGSQYSGVASSYVGDAMNDRASSIIWSPLQ